mgnify:CR=1 FL=1
MAHPSELADIEIPAHVDPTMALHERIHLVEGDEVIDSLAIDLRGW